ncbi:MAG TPA: hypothetical protein VIY49_31390 [Bryobacteraceae bacterium]
MADGEKSKVRLDAFTAKVVLDPKNPGDSLLLTGFLGAAADSKQTRIYWDPSLSSYVDVDTADIIHAEPLPKEHSPLGGSYIWVKRSAEVSVSAGGQTTKSKFFQGPVMSAYGGTFGAAGAGAGMAVMAAAVHLSALCPTIKACTHQAHCYSQGCFPTIELGCPYAAAGVAGAAAAQPAFVGSYARGCWYSWDACPTMYGCGPHHTPGCPQAPMAAGAAQPAFVGSYARGCWYSWDACPTMYGCGPHHTPCCPQAPMAAGAAQPAFVGSYAPHCWYSWGACPTMYGCGPHHTPGCPQAPMAAAGAAPQGIVSVYPHLCPTPTVFQCKTLAACLTAAPCPITIHHCWPTNPQGLPC